MSSGEFYDHRLEQKQNSFVFVQQENVMTGFIHSENYTTGEAVCFSQEREKGSLTSGPLIKEKPLELNQLMIKIFVC